MSSSPRTPCRNKVSNIPAVWYLNANAFSDGKKPICKLIVVDILKKHWNHREITTKAKKNIWFKLQLSSSRIKSHLLILVYSKHIGFFNFVLCPFSIIVISRNWSVWWRLFNVQPAMNNIKKGCLVFGSIYNFVFQQLIYKKSNKICLFPLSLCTFFFQITSNENRICYYKLQLQPFQVFITAIDTSWKVIILY